MGYIPTNISAIVGIVVCCHQTKRIVLGLRKKLYWRHKGLYQILMNSILNKITFFNFNASFFFFLIQTNNFIEKIGKSHEELYEIIKNIRQLRECLDEEVIKKYNVETWITIHVGI